MRPLVRPMPPTRRPAPPVQEQQPDPYPQQQQWPQADQPQQDQPFMAEPAPLPSPVMESIEAKQVAGFIETAMNSALGLQVHLHHFAVRRVHLPSDACATLADLFQDLADSLRPPQS